MTTTKDKPTENRAAWYAAQTLGDMTRALDDHGDTLAMGRIVAAGCANLDAEEALIQAEADLARYRKSTAQAYLALLETGRQG